MKIYEALRKTSEAETCDRPEHYAKENDNFELCWYRKDNNHYDRHVSLDAVLDNLWECHYGKKEIRPKIAGEFWVNKAGGIVFTYFNKTVGRLTCISKSGDVLINGMSDMEDIIHGQNGWERVYSPDEDENVERIVIEEVKWRNIRNGVNGMVTIPKADTDVEWDELVNKPPMKMILEIKKEDK